MEHFKLQIFSTSQLGGTLGIEFTEEYGEIVFDFLWVFGANFSIENQSISLDCRQQYTIEFRERLDSFVSKYKSLIPSVQSLGNKFNKLQCDEWFFVFQPIDLDTKQKYELEKELDILNDRKSGVSEGDIKKLFGSLMDNYELINFDLDRDRKIKIGEAKKSKRICRFCHKSEPEVSFKKEAHAISEALGNKKLILNEECDDCNEFFDENVERDFIHYHDLVRIMFGVKNKENVIPKMKGKDFNFFKSNEDSLNVAVVRNVERDTDQLPASVSLNTGKKIKLQNLYKALCKFSLSVIETKYLKHFSETIKWLRGEKDAEFLPKIAVLKSPHALTNRPELTLHLRNNENDSIPYLVGEFKFTFYVYIFIVPFSDCDSKSFINSDEYQDFLNCFLHIRDTPGISYDDFSQNIERDLSFNISFEKNEKLPGSIRSSS